MFSGREANMSRVSEMIFSTRCVPSSSPAIRSSASLEICLACCRSSYGRALNFTPASFIVFTACALA